MTTDSQGWTTVVVGETAWTSDEIIAWTRMQITCRTATTRHRCLAALARREKRMRSQPPEIRDAMKFELVVTSADPSGAGIICVLAAWFDEDYFNKQSDAALAQIHAPLFEHLAISPQDIQVRHWRPAQMLEHASVAAGR
jgi:hypothetical protein